MQKLGTATAQMSASLGVGGALGLPAAALLAENFNWHTLFWTSATLGAIVFVLVVRFVPESAVRSGGRFDLLGGVGLSAGLISLLLAISQGGDWGWASARVIGLFVLAAVLAPVAVRRSAHHEAPAIDLEVFRSRTVALANGATFLYSVGFFGMLLANVLFLTSVWHYSTLEAGLAITPGPLLVAVLSGPSGRLAARVGYGPVPR